MPVPPNHACADGIVGTLESEAVSLYIFDVI